MSAAPGELTVWAKGMTVAILNLQLGVVYQLLD